MDVDYKLIPKRKESLSLESSKKDKDDENTLLPLVHVYEVNSLMKKGIISGGMIPKIDCCVRAIRQNVKKAVIIDGRIPHSILIEMLSKDGIGTMFKR